MLSNQATLCLNHRRCELVCCIKYKSVLFCDALVHFFIYISGIFLYLFYVYRCKYSFFLLFYCVICVHYVQSDVIHPPEFHD